MILHCKITISWFTAYMYLFAFLHDDINNNTSIDSYLFDFTYCVPRSFSLLSCIGQQLSKFFCTVESFNYMGANFLGFLGFLLI